MLVWRFGHQIVDVPKKDIGWLADSKARRQTTFPVCPRKCVPNATKTTTMMCQCPKIPSSHFDGQQQ
jgi:hypothetical protein